MLEQKQRVGQKIQLFQIDQLKLQDKQRYFIDYFYVMSQANSNNNDKKQELKEDLDIDNLINQFEEGELNLTNQQKKEGEQQAEDAEVMRKIKEQYQKFMKEMQTGEQGQPEQGQGGLGKVFQELLTGLGDDDKSGQEIGKKFEDMFKNLESPEHFEKAASDLLNEFMDKSLLEEPLKETKLNYEGYIKKIQEKGGSVPAEHMQQYQIVCQLVNTLEAQPSNKQKMIDLFSKLQEKGTPPEGIAPSFGFF